MACHHDPLQCVLPPFVLDRIARNGDDRQRAWALDMLHRDTTIRMARAAAGPPRGSRMVRAHALGEAEQREPQRTIYTCLQQEDLSTAVVVRHETDGPSDDPAVNEAFEGLGATFELYSNVFERNSIDDEGLPLNGYVHYGRGYDNAFWDGHEMVFGDGDGELFNRFTLAIDVIGHELTHGVTEDEAGLVYVGQPGALNESVSDVFGSLVKQRVLNQTADQADWLIGAGLLAPGVDGVALRSMKAPGTAYDDPILGKDPQPAHMRDYVRTTADNGGVHINSGIPNHAFQRLAVALGGHAWEKAGAIWYETLRSSTLRSTTGFHSFARITLRSAQRVFGAGGAEEAAVIQAWSDVGIALSAYGAARTAA